MQIYDLKKFFPIPLAQSENFLIIGTVKSLEDKYGIHILLKAFTLVTQRLSEINLKLLIVGKGSRETAYKELAKSLGIFELTEFTGFIPMDEVPIYQNKLDIAVFPSICEESFGVSVIEAAACAKPVIVTDRGGFPEVVNHGEIGLIVPHNDIQALADAIIKLITDEPLRKALGEKGKFRVSAFYDWEENLKKMTSFYETTIP